MSIKLNQSQKNKARSTSSLNYDLLDLACNELEQILVSHFENNSIEFRFFMAIDAQTAVHLIENFTDFFSALDKKTVLLLSHLNIQNISIELNKSESHFKITNDTTTQNLNYDQLYIEKVFKLMKNTAANFQGSLTLIDDHILNLTLNNDASYV